MKKVGLIKLLVGLTLVASGAFAVGSALSNKKAEAAEAAVPSNVYFQWTGSASSTWGGWGASSSEIYAHFIKSDGTGITSWHGNSPSETFTVGSTTYLRYTVPSNSAKVVFNICKTGWGDSDNNQTVDLTIPTDGKSCFVPDSVGSGKANGSWFDFNRNIANGGYLRGKINGVTDWGDGHQEFMGTDDNPYKKTLELSAGDFIKAVAYSDGKLVKWINLNNASGTAEFPASIQDGNAYVTKAAKYNISISWNHNNDGNEYWDYVFEDEATTWSKVFLASMTCNNNGASDLTWNTKQGSTNWSWADFADETTGSYKDLGTIAKNALYEATAKTVGSQIEMAAKRHDVCVAHYGWSAFIKNSSGVLRSNANVNFHQILNSKENTNTIAIIVIISLVSVTAIGGYFFIKKRQEN